MLHTTLFILLRSAIVAICLCISLLSFAFEIQTLQDFRAYNLLHVQRVQKLGVYLYNKFPGEFPDLNVSLVEGFLAQHDYPKLNEPELQRDLFRLYGRPIDSAEMIKLRNEVVARVNEAEHEYAYAYFAATDLLNENGSLTSAAQQLLRIEMIADLVDRYLNPLAAEEFAREMRPASEMPALTPREKWLAQHLERRYFELVRGMLYHDNVACGVRLRRQNMAAQRQSH